MIRCGLFLGCLALTACGGLKSDAPGEQIYVLHAAAPAAAAGPAVGALSLQRTLVQPGLATARIALVRPGNRMDYYADSRWGAQLPVVVDAFATESLLASGRFAQVTGVDRPSGAAQFQLALTVRHFEAEYGTDEKAAPRARVTFECTLSGGVPRANLGRCDGEAMVPATANRMGAIVEALEAAAQQAMAQVVEKSTTLAAAAPARQP